jgi:hypothetical protein
MTANFQTRQQAFAAHIRDPLNVPVPEGIEDRRMAIYRDLMFNNLNGFLAGAFPVCHRLMGESRWQVLVRQFMADHRCETPYFLEISQEFLSFLMARADQFIDRPYWIELAHYEWVELALDTLDASLPEADRQGDLLAGVPVVSPLAWNLRYSFPVHRIGAEYQPTEPEPVCLVVCRGRDDRVQFSHISLLSSQLLALLQEKAADGWSGQACLDALAQTVEADARAMWQSEAQSVLQFFLDRDILLGVRP